MKIAAIDLGSNTFHLLIAEYKDNKIDILFKTNKPVRLSEDITRTNSIIPAAFDRGLSCLQEYKTILDEYNVDIVKAVATSAIRSASNGNEFIEKAYQLTAIEIEIISGDREAELIYEGVKASGVIQGRSIIMDIGGGSTEFIFCDQEKSYRSKSYNIGAARLMQKYFKTDPISAKDLEVINIHLQETLSEISIFNKEFKATNLIGSAGAFETYIEMINPEANIKSISCAEINLNQYKNLSSVLKKSTHQERLEMPNLIPLRVDMIVMACVLTDYILDNLNVQNMYMSTYDLKYGILNKV